MFVDFHILNELGSPSINSNVFANRPSAGQVGRLFVSTDTYEIYRDNGTTWDLIGGPGSSTVTGTGAATQIAYWTASQAIGGSNNLWWDNTNGRLGVKTNTPGAGAEIKQTDGIGLYSNFTTNAGSGSGTTAFYALNTTNGSGYSAVIEEKTPNATAGQYPLLIKHSLSSGTAGVGMGTGLHFQLQDDAGNFKTTQLTVENIDAAAATYKTRYRFMVQNNGSSTAVAYLNATGLGLFTATPGAALDIHSTGIIAQLNSTGTTNNAYLAFQRNGSGIWRIGDSYNGGNNFFEVHNTVLGVDAMEFQASTNKSSFQAQETYTTGLARGNYFDYNLSIAAGGSFSAPNAITALGASLDLTLAGSATIAGGARSGLDAYNTISFTGTGTLTQNQGAQLRTYANLTTGWAFNGSATGTISHLSGIHVRFPDNSGSAVTISNNYGILINDQTANTGTVTYTNRWGIYQEGASDLNYMAANLLLGSTTNTGNKLQVTGTSYFNGNVGIGTNAPVVNLHIESTQASMNLRSTTSASPYIDFYNSTTSLIGNFYALNGGGLVWGTSGGTERMRLNDSGNLGLGVTPSAWSVVTALQVKQGSLSADQSSNITSIINNAFYDGSSNKYIQNGASAIYQQFGGQHIWYNAPSGTAGNAISFTQVMTLDTNGNLGLNGTAFPFGNYRYVTVYGNSTTTGGVFQTRNSDSTQVASFYVDSSGCTFGTQTNSNLLLHTNNSEKARITSNGNFLIGTTTDSGQKLQVFGTSKYTDNIEIDSTSQATILLRRGINTVSSNITFITGSTLNWFFGTNALGTNLTNLYLYNYNTSKATLDINYSNDLVNFGGAIKTANPTTGTAAEWKLGSRVAATVVVNTTEYIEVDIGGTLYKLATVS